jgi:tripartite-type tricarboxylate transporter receptor subunit TctC
VSSTWWGMGVPAATPRAIVERLAAAHAEVVKRPAYAARLAELAMEPLVLDRAQTNAFVKAEIAKWRKIATAANVTLD